MRCLQRPTFVLHERENEIHSEEIWDLDLRSVDSNVIKKEQKQKRKRKSEYWLICVCCSPKLEPYFNDFIRASLLLLLLAARSDLNTSQTRRHFMLFFLTSTRYRAEWTAIGRARRIQDVSEKTQHILFRPIKFAFLFRDFAFTKF